MNDSLFKAELRDCARINEIAQQRVTPAQGVQCEYCGETSACTQECAACGEPLVDNPQIHMGVCYADACGCGKAEYEGRQAPFAFMAHDDPDYWG